MRNETNNNKMEGNTMTAQEAQKEMNEIARLDRYCESPGKLRENWYSTVKRDVQQLLSNIDFELEIEVKYFSPKFGRGEPNPKPDYSGTFWGETPEGKEVAVGYGNQAVFWDTYMLLDTVEATLAVWKWCVS